MKRVLLVEDDPSIRRYVRMALEDLPIELEDVGDIASALAALRVAPVDLVLTDLMLPDGHGTELLAQLQSEPALWCNARAVVFSAGVSGDVRQRLSELGVWQVLQKPVSMAELVGCVERALAGHALATEAALPSAADEAGAIAEHFAGNAGLFRAFKATSVAQYAQDLLDADEALQAGDRAGLRRVAHNVKTVLRLLGRSEASERARALEAAAALSEGGESSLPMLWAALRHDLLDTA